jgi:hypothetical protein
MTASNADIAAAIAIQANVESLYVQMGVPAPTP